MKFPMLSMLMINFTIIRKRTEFFLNVRYCYWRLLPSQQPVDGRHNADAFTVNLIITSDGKSNEGQLVTTQDRRGSDERTRLSLESFFSFYIVGYLNEFHSLVLIAYDEVDFLRTRTLLVIIFKASRLSYINFAKMHIFVLQTLLKCIFLHFKLC